MSIEFKSILGYCEWLVFKDSIESDMKVLMNELKLMS